MFGEEEFARAQAARQQVISFAGSLTPDQFLAHRVGRWHALETLEHVYRFETAIVRGLMRELTTGVSAHGGGVAPGRHHVERVTDRSFIVDAPANLKPRGQFPDWPALFAELRRSRADLKDLVGTADSLAQATLVSLPHPVFGDVSFVQWVDLIGYHDLRHLDQMREELAACGV
ncbi:MAG: DinB family protein [Firmicutes bacterium]|nr:DinB family protein [Bacillota bacterium]